MPSTTTTTTTTASNNNNSNISTVFLLLVTRVNKHKAWGIFSMLLCITTQASFVVHDKMTVMMACYRRIWDLHRWKLETSIIFNVLCVSVWWKKESRFRKSYLTEKIVKEEKLFKFIFYIFYALHKEVLCIMTSSCLYVVAKESTILNVWW